AGTSTTRRKSYWIAWYLTTVSAEYTTPLRTSRTPEAPKRTRIWWSSCSGVAPDPTLTSPSERPTTLLVGAVDGVALNQAVKTPVWGWSNAVMVKLKFWPVLHAWPMASGRMTAGGPSAGGALAVSSVVPLAASTGFPVAPLSS